MKMKKYDFLNKARHYYTIANVEKQEKGDTMRYRDLLLKCIDNYNIYYNKLNGRIKCDYELFEALKEEYYEELIFTPTVEDIEEMRYWI